MTAAARRRAAFVAGCLLLSLAARVPADADTANADREAIIAAVDDMFVALKERDADAWRRLMHPDGVWFVQSVDADGASKLEVDTTAKRIAALPSIQLGIDDRYWSPRIESDGHVATFWADYVATVDGEIIACGKDAFQLVKVDGDWLIANIMFSQRTAGCPERGEIVSD